MLPSILPTGEGHIRPGMVPVWVYILQKLSQGDRPIFFLIQNLGDMKEEYSEDD